MCDVSAKLKVRHASLGEEREGSRVADISINAARGPGRCAERKDDDESAESGGARTLR